MKKYITIIISILFISACESTSIIDEIKKGEDIILEEGAKPLIINDNSIEKEKENLLVSDGYISVKDLNTEQKDVLNKLLENNIIVFEFNSYELTENSKKILEKHVDFLKSNHMIKVIVEGHTDEKGEKSYNLTLGERRASQVINYMTRLGIDQKRLVLVSYGESKPLSNENNENAWQKNRRSSLVYN
jgi:peptidoglycan-associated lipoprotein